MSTDLTRLAMPDMSQAAIAARMDYAKTLAASGLIPQHYQRQPANVLVAIETGLALGIPPIQALSSIAVIKGKATMSADLMSAIVRRAGHKLRVVEHDGAVTVTLIRRDDPEGAFTVTWDQVKAQRAGLWGQRGPWTQYPSQMLRARAITEVCRQGASDALMGVIYTPEEMGASVDEEGQIITPPTQAPPTQAASALPSVDEVHAATDTALLREWWQQAQAAGRMDLRAVIEARATQLQDATPEPAPVDDGVVDAEVIEDDTTDAQTEITLADLAEMEAHP